MTAYKLELELGLIQARMTHKPLLWVEAGAHAVRKKLERDGVVWLARMSRGACVFVCCCF